MTDQTPKHPRGPRGRRLRKAGLWSGGLILALAVALVIGVLAVIGTRVTAPDWLRDRITARINSDIDGVSLGFGDMSFVLQNDWVPRLALHQVVIRDQVGTPLAQLSDVQSAVALGPLLRGELRPGSIRLSGARVTLRRAADGVVGVSVGDAAPAVEEAETFAALVERVDTFLQRPHYSALTEVTANNLTLRFEDARVGKAWTVDGGRISLTRDGDELEFKSDFALLGARDYATTLEASYTGKIGKTASEFSVEFEDMPAGDIAGQSPALTWLEALEAPISGSITVAVDEAGALGPLETRLEIGEGTLSPSEGARPVAFDHASTHFTYDPDAQLIRFHALKVDSRWVSAQVEGQTHLAGMEDGWPDALLSQFQLRELRANPMQLYDAPVDIEGANLDMRLDLDPFRVTLGELSLSDQGKHLVLRGDVLAEPDGWRVSVDGLMPEIAPDRLLQLWPKSLEPKVRVWITENIRQIDLSNIKFALRSEPRQRPDFFLSFDFENLTTQFIKRVPVIENGAGHAAIYDNRFIVAAHRGHVTAAEGGRIDIAGSSFDIPDMRVKRGPAKVRLKTNSTITAALSLLNEEPFRFLDKAGRPVTLADGRAMVEGELDFLVVDDLRPEDVAFHVDGTLRDVRSETLVEGRVLAASELTLVADNTRLAISGEGRIGRVPFGGGWTMPLVAGSNGRSNVDGWIELSERFADEFGIGLPPGSISGAGRGNVKIAFGNDTPRVFNLTSDLVGTGLRLRPLGWQISEAASGVLEVDGSLGTPPKIDRLLIDAGGLRAQGEVTLNPDGQLQQANFGRVQLGTWIDAPVDLVGLGGGRAPLVRVLGGEIDLRLTSLAGDGQGGDQGDKGPVSLRLDRLQISDTIALTDFNAELDMTHGPDGTFSGKVNGQSMVTGRVSPVDKRSAFVITSQDAGGVMRSANILKQARDGTMQLVLIPAEGVGTYRGKLDASNLRVKDAPAIAALLNALSIIGLLDQLGGEGIHFTQVQAEFLLAPDRVTLYSGSAVGASLGISMEGYYYLEAGQMDMEGVVSPVYAVNAIGGLFSRQGEGLVGFQYGLKGPTNSPRVQVNPLSVLTPGMFREIFRRPPPKPSGQPGDVVENERPQGDQSRDQDR